MVVTGEAVCRLDVYFLSYKGSYRPEATHVSASILFIFPLSKTTSQPFHLWLLVMQHLPLTHATPTPATFITVAYLTRCRVKQQWHDPALNHHHLHLPDHLFI